MKLRSFDYYVQYGQTKEKNHQKELSEIKDNELKETSFLYASYNNNTNNIINTYLEALKDNSSVCHFSIKCDGFDKDQLFIIADFLIKRNNIKKIQLWGINQFGKDETIEFEKLAIFTDLFKIKFSILEFPLCQIKFEGAQILAKALCNNNYLKKIKLACSNIGNEGLKLILKALAHSETIEEIDFNQNKITDEGTLYTGQFLVVNKSIIDLNLYGNEITNEGLKILAENLKINQSLTKLILVKNKLTTLEEGFGELKQATEQMLKINSYNNYIKKLKIQKETSSTISEDNRYALELELDNAQILKNYNKDQVKDYLKALDHKIKCQALGITPAPLEIILRSEKFLKVMQTYIFKCTGQNYDDQAQAVAKTIELLKSKEAHTKLYSFYQFIQSSDIEVTAKEQKAIAQYQMQPEYCDNFMASTNRETRVNATVKIMSDKVDVAIDIQQLNTMFKQDLSEEVSDNFDVATKYYLENGGYAIGVIGEYCLDIEGIKQHHGHNIFSMIAH